jgi:hypothetical protein
MRVEAFRSPDNPPFNYLCYNAFFIQKLKEWERMERIFIENILLILYNSFNFWSQNTAALRR